MARTGWPKEIRRRLASFARGVARPFADARRRQFLTDLLPGLLLSGHGPLSQVTRALSPG